MTENMYCPRCGNQFSESTSFCRTCGLSLDGVSEIVTGEAATAPEMRSGPNYKFIQIGLAMFIFGTVIGLANVIVRDLGLFPEIYGKAICLAFISMGLLSIALSVIFPSKRYVKRKQSKSTNDSERRLKTAPLGEHLPPASINNIKTDFPKDDRLPVTAEPGTVTEHTTRQLG
jgi:hypothetical protein